MNTHIIVVRSITYALKAQQLLQKRGMKAYIQRNTEEIQGYGCGYGVKVYADPERALEILNEADIRVVTVVESKE